MHGCSAFFTLDVRVAILLALFASVLRTLALSSFSPWYLAAKYVFDSHTPTRPFPYLLAPERRRRDARETTRAPTSR